MQTRRHLMLSGSSEPSLCLVLVLLLGACVTEDVDPEAIGGSAGSGGGSGAGGTGSGMGGGSSGNNSGGTGGGAMDIYRSDPTYNTGTVCPSPMQALMTDFTPTVPMLPVVDAGADAGADAALPATVPVTSFGDYTTQFSASIFAYPGAGDYAVTSDTSGGAWHLSGNLGDYSGFGLTFGLNPSGCTLVDATAYDGISFTIQGSAASPVGMSIQINVGTAANDIAGPWLNRNVMPAPVPPVVNKGRCIPAMAQYDGTCGAPRFTVPVTATAQTVTILWSDFVGGTPTPNLDPAEITGINWNFQPPTGAGTTAPTPYPVDITIDNLSFVDNP